MLFEQFCASLPADALVVEAGAYHGEDTLRLAERVGEVHAFEPISFNELTATYSPRANISCWNLALSDHVGEQEMWVSGGPHTAASSLLEPTGHLALLPALSFEEKRTVRATTLADWSMRHLSAPIDGLWLDLQGMELRVLKAAGPVLDTVTSIVLEVSHVELYDGCPLAPEVGEWLATRGFSIAAEEGQGAEQTNWLVTR